MVMKFFSERGVRVKIQTECDAVETASLLMVDNHKLGVVLIWKAEDSGRVLIKVSRSQAGCSNVTFPSLCDSTCSKVNWQHMAKESVKCCSWDQLMCIANDIGTWSCEDVCMDCLTWFFASGKYGGGLMEEGVAMLFR